MRRRTRNAFSMNRWSLLRVALIGGAVGIAIALVSMALSRCCIDPLSPGAAPTLFRKASKYLWPTNGIMPAFVTGPLDRRAVLVGVVLAVLANALPYAAVAMAYSSV